MQTKQTVTKRLALGVIVGVLIGVAVWNANRAEAIIVIDGRVHFGIATLLPVSQNARLNFVRVDGEGEDPTEMQPCVIEVRNFDAAGRLYGTPDTLELRPGIAVSRTVIPEGTTQIEGRFQFRSTFKMIPPDIGDRRCTVIPTLEVFNKETGATLVMYSATPGFSLRREPSVLN